MSPTLLLAANQYILFLRRMTRNDPMGAVYPRDYYRPADRPGTLGLYI